SNRRIHGLWQSTIPSRFLDELPETDVDVVESGSAFGGYGQSRFDKADPFASSYSTPGWQRYRQNAGRAEKRNGYTGGGRLIEGELIAKSVTETGSRFSVGERVFHQKFGYGKITRIDGNKLSIDFEKAGQKKVVESFVESV
ncbi:MAG: ATP-dependent DNA helicase, partial [Hyphomicrobiales bacterium]|nr:ATP-dependent DNA helicase [Hyphomicrobiales bacterium]